MQQGGGAMQQVASVAAPPTQHTLTRPQTQPPSIGQVTVLEGSRRLLAQQAVPSAARPSQAAQLVQTVQTVQTVPSLSMHIAPARPPAAAGGVPTRSYVPPAQVQAAAFGPLGSQVVLLPPGSTNSLGTVQAIPSHSVQALPPQLAFPVGAQPLRSLGNLARKQVPVAVEVVVGDAPGQSAQLLPQVYVPPYCPHRVATIPNVEHLTPDAVRSLLSEEKCLLVDLRGEDRIAGLIEGALHVPAAGVGGFLGRCPELVEQWADRPLVVFFCQYSAHRAPQCANWYRQKANPAQRVAILSGGFRGWESVGLPVLSVAEGDARRAADDAAMKLGTDFVRSSPPGTGHQLPATHPATSIHSVPLTLQDGPRGLPPVGTMPGPPPKAQGLAAQPVIGPTLISNAVPTIPGVDHFDPVMVRNLMRERKCVLIDLRGEDQASGLIEGALHVPAVDKVPFLTKVPDLVRQFADERLVIFTCQYSAHRAPQCANWYRQRTGRQQQVGILSGGFRGWEAAGLPVQGVPPPGQALAADDTALQLGAQFMLSVDAARRQAAQPQEQRPGSAGTLVQAQAGALPRHLPATYAAPLSQQAPPAQTSSVRAPAGAQPAPPTPPTSAPPQHEELPRREPQHPVPQALPQQAPQAQQQQQASQASQLAAATAQQVAAPAPRVQAARKPYVPPHLPNTVPTIKGVEHIDPETVGDLLAANQCLLVDLRGEDRSSGLIEGAVHEPAIDTVPFTAKVPKLVERWADRDLVVFTCQYSAHRAPQCANWYREKTGPRQRVGILSGGFRGWEAVGLPVAMPADKEKAKKADEVALQLGHKFVEGCLAGVPGGGFCMPGAAPKPPVPAAPEAASGPVAATPGCAPVNLPNMVPTVENVENLDPETVQELLQNHRCLLVDLRGEDRAAGLIEGAVHEPAIDSVPFPTRVPQLVKEWVNQNLVVFTCQYSAHRAPQCANWYRQKCSPSQRVAILCGGFRGWEASGLPIQALASGKKAEMADEAALQLGSKLAGDPAA